MKLKKGDTVLVIIGKDKGKKGKIEKVFPKKNRVLIPGVNLFKKHVKSTGKNKAGGIVDKALSLSAANVALVCPKCEKATRIGYQVDKEGKKLRICRKCGTFI